LRLNLHCLKEKAPRPETRVQVRTSSPHLNICPSELRLDFSAITCFLENIVPPCSYFVGPQILHADILSLVITFILPPHDLIHNKIRPGKRCLFERGRPRERSDRLELPVRGLLVPPPPRKINNTCLYAFFFQTPHYLFAFFLPSLKTFLPQLVSCWLRGYSFSMTFPHTVCRSLQHNSSTLNLKYRINAERVN
jgi:hypothetical protein